MSNKNTIRTVSLIALLFFSSCKNSTQKQEDLEFDIITIEKSQNSGVIQEVKIQNQTWSKMNINISKLLDGREIKYCKSCNELKNAFDNQIPAYCYLNFDIKNSYLGKLYNYYVIFDTVGIAPKGWKIPSKNDFINLAKSHGKLKKNDWDLIEYEFVNFSFKEQSSNEKNKQNTGFDAFLLGNTDSDFDCQFIEGVSDFWTNSKDLSKYEKNIFGDTLYERTDDIFFTARFQDNTDENLIFKSEGLYLLPGATKKSLMALRLIKR
jgi:uncharacterized protein (TIGR02145 family)